MLLPGNTTVMKTVITSHYYYRETQSQIWFLNLDAWPSAKGHCKTNPNVSDFSPLGAKS